MNEEQALSVMVAPGQKRPGIWRGGIVQIHVTRACDQSCFGCTQGSNLGGKPVVMMPHEFELACQSLEGYWGVVGVFGGNPAMHPYFPELCEILARYFPKEQRGLWCNNPRGHGTLMRKIFNPAVSNLNVHCSAEAFEEFKLDWPESRPFGLTDSRHSPPFVAMLDVEPDEGKRWELISGCDINRLWSAMICYVPNRGLRAYFCELAGAQAMLHANDPAWPDTGLDPTKDIEVIPSIEERSKHYAKTGELEPPTRYVKWWQLPMNAFKDQVAFHCHRCGIPLRRYGQKAIGGEYEEVSATHEGIYRTKTRGREVKVITLDEGPHLNRVTDYVPNGSL